MGGAEAGLAPEPTLSATNQDFLKEQLQCVQREEKKACPWTVMLPPAQTNSLLVSAEPESSHCPISLEGTRSSETEHP